VAPALRGANRLPGIAISCAGAGAARRPGSSKPSRAAEWCAASGEWGKAGRGEP
jgi:hypothetical protein